MLVFWSPLPKRHLNRLNYQQHSIDITPSRSLLTPRRSVVRSSFPSSVLVVTPRSTRSSCEPCGCAVSNNPVNGDVPVDQGSPIGRFRPLQRPNLPFAGIESLCNGHRRPLRGLLLALRSEGRLKARCYSHSSLAGSDWKCRVSDDNPLCIHHEVATSCLPLHSREPLGKVARRPTNDPRELALRHAVLLQRLPHPLLK